MRKKDHYKRHTGSILRKRKENDDGHDDSIPEKKGALRKPCRFYPQEKEGAQQKPQFDSIKRMKQHYYKINDDSIKKERECTMTKIQMKSP